MSKAVKEMMTQELASNFEEMESCLVVSYHGLSVEDTDSVRRELYYKGLKMQMVKNSIAERALERVGKADVVPLLDGPSAFLTGGDGPVEAAKAFADLRKTHAVLVMRGGLLEGQVLSADQAEALAKIPSRDVLMAQILAGIQAPLSGLAGALSGVQQKLTMLVKAVAESKGESDAPAEETQ